MSLRKKRITIYASRLHMLATLAIVMAPFLFLLIFSHFAKIAASRLFLDIFSSIARLAAAYSIALILGWLFAVLFYQGKRSLVALPIFDVLQSFPTFAALPLATLFWGPSPTTVIFFLVITIIWPVFFSILSSLKLIRHDWQEAVTIIGLSGFDYVRSYLLPVTIPGIITGSVIGLGEAWEAVVATEIIIGIHTGLGNFFESFSGNTTVTLFGILGFLMIIFSLNKLVWLPLLEWSHRTMEE